MTGSPDVVPLISSMGGWGSLLAQAIGGGAVVGLGGILFGLLDRWRMGRRDRRGDSREDDQDWEAVRKAIVADLRTDLADARRRVDDLEEEAEQEKIKRARVWRAARHIEGWAQTMVSEANQRIQVALSVGQLLARGVTVQDDGRPVRIPEPLPPAPALESLLGASPPAE